MAYSGAVVNAKTNFQFTALHYVGNSGDNPGIAQALLEARAEPNCTNYYKQTPLVTHQILPAICCASVVHLLRIFLCNPGLRRGDAVGQSAG